MPDRAWRAMPEIGLARFGAPPDAGFMVVLKEIVEWIGALLEPWKFEDYKGACNGLQVENASGQVSKVAMAVDACEFTIASAAREGADLLVTHHGLAWGAAYPMTDGRFRKIRTLIESGIAVYAMHLPLDAHPEIGNNALLAKSLGVELTEPFLDFNGSPIGLRGRVSVGRDELVARLESAVGGPVVVAPGGPESVRSLGIVTGGAGSEVGRAAAEGVDTFISGEAPHWAYTLAEECGVNLLLGGHYATETFGVRALGERVAEHFSVPSVFIDHPTGL